METTNIVDFARRDGMTDALTELLKTGARALIASAVETELASYMTQFSELRTEAGHAAVVRDGHHPARPFQTGIGPVSVRIPKVRSKDGTPVTPDGHPTYLLDTRRTQRTRFDNNSQQMGHGIWRCQGDHRTPRSLNPSLPHPGNRERQLPLQGKLSCSSEKVSFQDLSLISLLSDRFG